MRVENLGTTRVSGDIAGNPRPPDSDYGSGGWGFEFLRACHRNPCENEGFVALGVSAPGRIEVLGAILHLK